LRKVHGLPSGEWKRLPNGKNVVCTLGETLLVKLVPPFWAEDAEREIEALKAVAGKLSIKTPILEREGHLEGWRVLVMSRLSGTTLARLWPTLEHEQKIDIAFQMGEVAAQLHAVEILELEALRIDWQTILKSQRNESITDSHLPELLRERLPAFLERVGELPSPRAQNVFLHGDVSAGNLLVQDMKIVGLLDFGDTSLGEFTHEFISPASHMFRGDKALLTAFYDGYDLPTDKRTIILQHQLMTRTLLWYGWEYLGSFVPKHLTSWEEVAAFYWRLVEE
jgi:hygromycin-B 7''-O-kinase